MKRRVDFVSNSSSSSFVVVVSNDMSLDTFCKKFADLCMTKTTSDDVNMRDQNIVKLRYCLSENVLLHLGQLYIRNAESVFDEDHCEYCGEEMSDEYREYWKSMVNDHKHAIAKFNEAKDDPSLDQYRDYEMYKDDYVDEDGKVHIIEQVWSGKHAVSRHMITTSIAFNRHEVCNDADFDEDMLRTRIQHMKDVGEVWHDHNDVMSEPRTYEVTTDTVLNTRELIAAGLKMRFDDWEKDLDKIEHMLNEGKKIYVIQHNYAGCGMLSDGVYSDYDVDMKSFIANDSSITLLSQDDE